MKLFIDKINWPDNYPNGPKTTVNIARDGELLLLHFEVKAEQVRAVAMSSIEPVWEDSCVEFFCQVPGEDKYMNLEINCIGTFLATRRKSRTEDVVPLSQAEMMQIDCRSSLPRKRIQQSHEPTDWEVDVKLPLQFIFKDKDLVFPLSLNCNFYKCGDKTSLPHYLSWQPIRLPNPDFHCPQFFGNITIK